MNKLGFGFLRLPKTNIDTPDSYDWETVKRMVDLFIENGGRYFDTCYTYLNGFSEYGIRECVVNRYSRDLFEIADKLPGYKCTCYEDCSKYFEEQLDRCGVEYFDVYMLHWLNQKNYDTAEKFDEFRFLREVKASGKARLIGFSYHDSAGLLDEILNKHPEVDVVQLQINYLDWESCGVESRKCYEVCEKHGKRVIVMEPVKGGTLATLPDEASVILNELHPEWSPASWAMRFVQSLDLVSVCLSGMNSETQMKDNLQNVDPLDAEELEVLRKVCEIINSKTAVPCTACRYCADFCPMNIPIPDYFGMYNELFRYPGDGWKIKPVYLQTTKTLGKASDCISCGSCSEHCPQKIDISKFMKDIASSLE